MERERESKSKRERERETRRMYVSRRNIVKDRGRERDRDM